MTITIHNKHISGTATTIRPATPTVATATVRFSNPVWSESRERPFNAHLRLDTHLRATLDTHLDTYHGYIPPIHALNKRPRKKPSVHTHDTCAGALFILPTLLSIQLISKQQAAKQPVGLNSGAAFDAASDIPHRSSSLQNPTRPITNPTATHPNRQCVFQPSAHIFDLRSVPLMHTF